MYDGEWVDNKMESEGIFTWPDGKRHIGKYVNDKKEGPGVMEWLL